MKNALRFLGYFAFSVCFCVGVGAFMWGFILVLDTIKLYLGMQAAMISGGLFVALCLATWVYHANADKKEARNVDTT